MNDERKAKIIEGWIARRQKSRTDLIWLCNNVLDYKDVCEEVHRPIAETLQPFYGGKDYVDENGNLQGYRPKYPDIWKLPHRSAKTLTLIPRFHLKSSVATIAHAIQWIINYPDIRICISSSTGDIAEGFVTAIRRHFQFNEKLRWLFPEFCPPAKKSADWGNANSFTVMNRKAIRREPTVSCISVGKIVASWHYDVIKNDDLVDKENVRTKEQIQAVNSHFSVLWPLLDVSKDYSGLSGWMDLIGTIYDHSDLHSVTLRKAKQVEAQADEAVLAKLPTFEERQKFRQQLKDNWKVLLKRADNINDKGERVALWPAGCPISRLDDLRFEMGSASYNSQMNMNPLADGQGLCTPDKLKWMKRKDYNDLAPRLRQHVTIDLAGMESVKGDDTDFTVLTMAGFDSDGRMYVSDVRHGRFTQMQVMENIFDLYDRYPRIIDFKIQHDLLLRGFLPTLKRECSKRGKFPMIVPIDIDNKTSKINRIKGLQPWFEMGLIRFVDDLACKADLEDEISYFPKFAHDDILDTLADQLQNRDGQINSDIYGGPEMEPPAKNYVSKNPDGTITLLGHPAQRMGEELWGMKPETNGVDEITGW